LPFVPTPETWALPDSYYAQLEEGATESANQAVNDAADRLLQNKDAQLVISTEVKTGRPQDVILEWAKQWGADLIIVGSHGYSGWQRFWLGSVSHAVAAHAPCSVEIVRQRKEH
jgi:nucleotide-binding universal stress UspA family protein